MLKDGQKRKQLERRSSSSRRYNECGFRGLPDQMNVHLEFQVKGEKFVKTLNEYHHPKRWPMKGLGREEGRLLQDSTLGVEYRK